MLQSNTSLAEISKPDYYWGGLTVFFTFLPAMLSFITIIGNKKHTWKDTNLAISVLVLPIIELLILFMGSKEILKDNAKIFETNVKLSQTQDSKHREEILKEKQKHQAAQQKDKSTLQIFKIFQCIGESGRFIFLECCKHHCDTRHGFLSRNILLALHQDPESVH